MRRAVALLALIIGTALVALAGASALAVAITAAAGLAILTALWTRPTAASPPTVAPEPTADDASALIEAIDDPILIIADSRIEHANAAALK
jgi:two-component system phosphate regulon sensor histidine kinase PhoR